MMRVSFVFFIFTIFITVKWASSSPILRSRRSLNGKHVHFKLYTRENIEEGVKLSLEDAVLDPKFDASRPTKIMTHGFLSSGSSDTIISTKNAFLAADDCNFIGVDWAACADNIYYPATAECAKDLGHYIGQFVIFLEKVGKVDIKTIHLIGHSLGAHAVSIVSQYYPVNKVGRITGLDPASPLFENVALADRIDPSDADFVDVIHTAIGFLGQKEAVGTVDFYPSGGSTQPGCGSNGECNHKRSVQYFVETVYPETRHKYLAIQCDFLSDAYSGDCNGEKGYLGYDAPLSKPGAYYVYIEPQ